MSLAQIILSITLLTLLTHLHATPWHSCPLSTHSPPLTNPALRAYCTKVNVPLGVESDRNIEIFVKRIVHEDAEMKQPAATGKSVFFLAGRIPGLASTQMESIMVSYMLKNTDVDAFTFDLRGSGRSARASCDLSQAEMPGSDGGVQITAKERLQCLSEWVDRENFTLDETARDIWRVINHLRAPQLDLRLATGEIYLYGYSFSSLVVQRALQIYVNEADTIPRIDSLRGIILDSALPTADDLRFNMHRFTLAELDLQFNEVGFELLQMCHDDDACSEHFRDEKTYAKVHPADFLNDLFDDLYGGHGWCPGVTDNMCQRCFRQILGWMARDRVRRQMIPAFLYRLRRCNEAANGDVSTLVRAVKQWKSIVKQGDPSALIPSLDSPMMMWQGFYNEMMPVPPLNDTEIEERFLSTRFAEEGNVNMIYDAPTWPLYEQSQYFNKTLVLPDGVDVLLLSGELDVISRPHYSKAIYDSLVSQEEKKARDEDAQNIHLVFFPTVTNFVLENALKRNDGENCGLIIMQQFINDPTDLNRGCAHDFFTPPNFDGDASMNQLVFGAKDLWDGVYDDPNKYPQINLWTFVGVESATVVFFTLLVGALLYWAFLLKLKVRKQNKLLANGDFDEIDFFFSKHRSQLVEDML